MIFMGKNKHCVMFGSMGAINTIGNRFNWPNLAQETMFADNKIMFGDETKPHAGAQREGGGSSKIEGKCMNISEDFIILVRSERL